MMTVHNAVQFRLSQTPLYRGLQGYVFFSYFCSKYRLRVLFRTVSINVLNKKRKISHILFICKLSSFQLSKLQDRSVNAMASYYLSTDLCVVVALLSVISLSNPFYFVLNFQ